MNTTVFDPSFIQKVGEVLDSNCNGGESVSRTLVCEKLGISTDHEHMITALVKGGAVPGFEVRRAPFSGIGRAGVKPVRAPRDPNAPAAPTREPKFPEGFLTQLAEVLDRLIPDETVCVTRDRVAQEMQKPGSKTEIYISQALKCGKVPGYVTTVGRKGGISRAVVTSDGAEAESEAEANTDS